MGVTDPCPPSLKILSIAFLLVRLPDLINIFSLGNRGHFCFFGVALPARPCLKIYFAVGSFVNLSFRSCMFISQAGIAVHVS